MKRLRFMALVTGVGAVISAMMSTSGCVGLTQMQDTVAKFDQGVHTASDAELSLFTQVQAAECNRDVYTRGFDFATAVPDQNGRYGSSPAGLDLRAGRCVHTELTDEQVATREKLLKIITLYADALQSLTNGTNDTRLSDESNKVAADIKTLGTQQKFSSAEADVGAALNAAMVTIATMVIDHSSYKHVKEAAGAMQAPLSIVVEELQRENSGDVAGLSSKADSLINEMRVGLDAARDKFGPASFLDVVYAKVTLEALIIAPPSVAKLNDTLDAIVKANAALARSTEAGAIPEISDLISRGQQASALFNASK
jgi:hypothetical protein